jgi:hypothetical protein
MTNSTDVMLSREGGMSSALELLSKMTCSFANQAPATGQTRNLSWAFKFYKKMMPHPFETSNRIRRIYWPLLVITLVIMGLLS